MGAVQVEEEKPEDAERVGGFGVCCPEWAMGWIQCPWKRLELGRHGSVSIFSTSVIVNDDTQELSPVCWRFCQG